MSDDQNLLDSIKRQEAERDKYPYGSENWTYCNDDVERMRAELHKRGDDDRYAVRGPWGVRA